MDTKGITVYCASSDDIDNVYFETARELGSKIAHAGLPAINGGGKMGLMGAINDAVLSCGGTAVGVIPQFMVDADRHHKSLSRIIITPDMATRKQILADSSIGVIALPGGVGTFEELFETMTKRKLHLYHGKIVILNVNHYYDHLIAMLEEAERAGFSYGERVWHVAHTVDDALEYILH